jgi:hypothetical protein
MPRILQFPRFVLPGSVLVWLLFTGTIAPSSLNGQFGGFGKTLDTALCAFGGMGLTKASQKMADIEVKQMKMPAAQAATLQRQFQLGLAMSLCNGGKSIVGTTFAKMSEKDKKQRQENIDAAVADSAPSTKTTPLPDHPDLKETITTDPIVADGDKECRTVKDYLAEQSQGDTALVKYCRKPPDGKFEVATL